MLNKILGFVVLLTLITSVSIAQQKPLPDFFIKKAGKSTVVINWSNNFGDECIQLNVQRSTDSLKNFRTIFATPAPQLPTNGYTDKNVLEGKLYYRIFYMLAGGAYYFTASKIPGEDTLVANAGSKAKDTLADFVPVTKPTPNHNTTILTKPSMVSKNKWGNVVIQLSSQDAYSYKMEIFDPLGDKILFKINHFENPLLILDKSSFLRAGRYKYVIYQNEKSVENGFLEITK